MGVNSPPTMLIPELNCHAWWQVCVCAVFVLFVVVLLDRIIPLGSRGYFATSSIDQADLKPRDPPVSAS